MFETTIQFKPRDQWRPGMTPDRLVEELDRVVKVPGLVNIWIPPIRNRIDMLATGIKSPIGIKIAGAHLADIDRVAQDVERVAQTVPGVSSADGGRPLRPQYRRRSIGRGGSNRR
jgi:Cu(I)/Ag(I) efflux system membrane protein CusA/SilA